MAMTSSPDEPDETSGALDDIELHMEVISFGGNAQEIMDREEHGVLVEEWRDREDEA